MHNPNVSAEAKDHSRQVVEEIQGPGAVRVDYSTEPSRRDTGDKEESRVLGGYKAALKSKSITIFALNGTNDTSCLPRTNFQIRM
jgi:hypothetical protein